MHHIEKLKAFLQRHPVYVTIFLVGFLIVEAFVWIGFKPMVTAVETLNPIFWLVSNLLILYVGIVLGVFVIGYFVLFDPNATTGGKFVFRFAKSLGGIIGLVFIGIFLNPTGGAEWFDYPGDVYFWRPFLRLVAYGYVAYTITALAILLVIRKWFPQKLRTRLDYEIVKARKETPTEEIDVPVNTSKSEDPQPLGP